MKLLPVLKSAIVRQQIVAALVAIFALIGFTPALDIDETVGAIMAGASALIAVWTIITRLFKPTPPITETAVEKAKELGLTTSAVKSDTQGGYAKVGVLCGVLVFAGCASLGIPNLKGFNARLAGGVTSVTTVREGASLMLADRVFEANKEIDGVVKKTRLEAAKADAENIQKQADDARQGLNIARDMKNVDFKTAEDRLESTLTILEALQRYLDRSSK